MTTVPQHIGVRAWVPTLVEWREGVVSGWGSFLSSEIHPVVTKLPDSHFHLPIQRTSREEAPEDDGAWVYSLLQEHIPLSTPNRNFMISDLVVRFKQPFTLMPSIEEEPEPPCYPVAPVESAVPFTWCTCGGLTHRECFSEQVAIATLHAEVGS